MAASTTTGLPETTFAPVRSDARADRNPRYIPPQAGRALEILGHAIEYLTDEMVFRGIALNSSDPQLEAVQLLMALNRQVYYECPRTRSFGDRCRALLHLQAR
jgi:hypothetical protein